MRTMRTHLFQYKPNLRTVILLACVAMAMLLVACGGDDKPAPAAPSPTTVPTVTATPGLSRETIAYRERLIGAVGSYTSASAVIQSLLKSPSVANQGWKDAVVKAGGDLKGAGGKIRDLKAPSCAAGEHGLLLQAVSTFDSGADALIVGIQDANTVKLREAEGLMNSGQTLVNQSIDRLNKLTC